MPAVLKMRMPSVLNYINIGICCYCERAQTVICCLSDSMCVGRTLYERFHDAFALEGEPNIPIDRQIMCSEEFFKLLERLRQHSEQHQRDHWSAQLAFHLQTPPHLNPPTQPRSPMVPPPLLAAALAYIAGSTCCCILLLVQYPAQRTADLHKWFGCNSVFNMSCSTTSYV